MAHRGYRRDNYYSDDDKGFLSYLGTFTKRILFFTVGFVVAFPVAGIIMYTGSTVKYGPLPTTELNPICGLFGIITFIVGLAMMAYAFKLK